jgi:hypothetical protein
LDNAKKPMFIQDFLKSKKNPQFALKYTDEVINEQVTSSAFNSNMLFRSRAFNKHVVSCWEGGWVSNVHNIIVLLCVLQLYSCVLMTAGARSCS